MNDTPIDLNLALPRDVLADCPATQLRATPADFSTWLFSHEAIQKPSVFRYLSYLKSLYELAHAIGEIYDLRSPPGSLGGKGHLRHIGSIEMMFLVNHLYILDSFEIAGAVLECGASHGYSTCVLSQACARLQRPLLVADSFEGLPPTRADQDFFRQGDYAASVESVRATLAQLGRSEAATLIQGFFSTSLKDFQKELCLLWLDVDLYESAQDVLTHVFPHLNPAGMIATHEFTDFHNRPHTRDEKCPPGAIFQAFERAGLAYRPVHLMRYLGMVGGPRSLQMDSGRLLPYLLKKLEMMDHRWRRYQELRESNTVRLAFRMKKLLPFRKTDAAEILAAPGSLDAMAAAEKALQT
jgi:hypothetical protein